MKDKTKFVYKNRSLKTKGQNDIFKNKTKTN